MRLDDSIRRNGVGAGLKDVLSDLWHGAGEAFQAFIHWAKPTVGRLEQRQIGDAVAQLGHSCGKGFHDFVMVRTA